MLVMDIHAVKQVFISTTLLPVFEVFHDQTFMILVHYSLIPCALPYLLEGIEGSSYASQPPFCLDRAAWTTEQQEARAVQYF